MCKPIAGFWNKDLKPTCVPVKIHKGFALMNTSIHVLRHSYCTWWLTRSYAGCNMFTDICFATIPIPIIMGLQMKQKTRMYLIFVLSLGYT